MTDDRPMDDFDPRFDGGRADGAADRPRSLVESSGPGTSPDDPKARILRFAIPGLAIAALFAIGSVFFSGLSPSATEMDLGRADAVVRAVTERPRRVCLEDTAPCAWLTFEDDQLLAFNTNGPLPEEYGRFGVAWCPTSGYFGANSTGSRWDQEGILVEGPSIRSLDRFTLLYDDDGTVTLDFTDLTAGLAEFQVRTVRPPEGPACEQIPFDYDSDLDLSLLELPPVETG